MLELLLLYAMMRLELSKDKSTFTFEQVGANAAVAAASRRPSAAFPLTAQPSAAFPLTV